MVILHTSQGNITLELDAVRAPKTVANFLDYVRAGHFDNTLFHRVIDGFMIQGGGFTPDFRQRPTRAPIENEATNGLKNVRYSVAMARTGDPHSATAQGEGRRARAPAAPGPGKASRRREMAGAIVSSDTLSPEPTSSIASRACRPATAACIRTCPSRMC